METAIICMSMSTVLYNYHMFLCSWW